MPDHQIQTPSRLLRLAVFVAFVILALSLTARLWGWPPYIAAMTVGALIMTIFVGVLASQSQGGGHDKQTGDRPIEMSLPQSRWRRRSTIAFYGLFAVLMFTIVVAGVLELSGFIGHGDNEPGPVFQPRSVYYLSKQGEWVSVSESEFQLTNAFFNIWGTLFLLCLLLLALHGSYFGEMPWGSSQKKNRTAASTSAGQE
jgi:hypothetical protein